MYEMNKPAALTCYSTPHPYSIRTCPYSDRLTLTYHSSCLNLTNQRWVFAECRKKQLVIALLQRNHCLFIHFNDSED